MLCWVCTHRSRAGVASLNCAEHTLDRVLRLDDRFAVQWGGHGSRVKYEHIVDDLLLNAEEQWRAGHDLHVDTLDVYLLEVRRSERGRERGSRGREREQGEEEHREKQGRGRQRRGGDRGPRLASDGVAGVVGTSVSDA